MWTEKPLACVIGDMDLLRPLGLAGIDCAVVARPGDPIRYSRHTRAALDWFDAWKQPAELAAELIRFAQTQPTAPVLFYEEDRDLLLVSRFRERLAPYFRFVVGEAELVEDLVDKARFQQMAERLELPVPRTRRLIPAHDSSPADLGLQLPIIVKPLTRRSEAWFPIAGHGKALRIASEAQLQEVWPRLADAGLEILAQELIEGAETSLESYHVYVDAAGETVAEFTGRKVRTYPAEFGYSTALTITDCADVKHLGRELVQRLDLRGVAKFDFKRAPNGRLYLLEVNPRFNLWHHPGAVAGVNLPALVYADLTGLPRPSAGAVRPGVRWCYLWHDAAAARQWKVPLHRWLPWALSCEAKSAMSLDDPMPFLRGVIWRRLSRVFARHAGGPAI